MTTNEIAPPHFACSHTYLVSSSLEKEALLRRDLADLTLRGITTKRLDDYVILRNEFNDIPASVAEIYETSIAYQERNAKNGEIKISVRAILGIADVTYTKKSAEYKSFNIKALSHLTPEEMFKDSENVIDKATSFKVKMTVNGLTPKMLTDLKTLRDELGVCIQATPVLEGNSLGVTVKRRNAANALYDETSSMCKIAIVYYQDKDKVKKGEYSIYDTKPSTVDRRGKAKANGFSMPKATAYVATTKIRIKIKTGTSVEVFFSLKRKGSPVSKSKIIKANPNIFITTTAADLGFDAEGGIYVLNIKNINEDDATFFIKIG